MSFPFNITNPGFSIVGLLTSTEAQFITDLVLESTTANEGDVLTWTAGAPAWEVPVGGFSDPLTTNGDIIARVGGTTTRLAQGGNGTFLGVSGGTLGYYSPAGSGDVVGPATATDNAIARFDLTTGKLIQNSVVTITDAGVMTVPNSIVAQAASAEVNVIARDTDTGAESKIGFNWGRASEPSLLLTDESGHDVVFGMRGSTVGILLDMNNEVSDQFKILRHSTDFNGGELLFHINTSGVTKISNYTDQPSNQVLVLQGDRATPATFDEIYQSFVLSDSAGNQDEAARIQAVWGDVTSGSESSVLGLYVRTAGTLERALLLDGDGLRPGTNDGGALGGPTAQFSDLFLAEGGVINWDNGDATITQTGNVLNVTGAVLQVEGNQVATKVGTPVDNQVGVWTGDGTIEGTAGLTFSANVLGVGTSAAGTVSSNGNQDLILQTGNASTGNITIVNGAAGDIIIASQAGIQLDSVDTASTVTISNGGTGTITDELNATNTSTYWNGPTGMSTAEIGLYAASAYFSLVNYGTGADDASEINLINGSTSPAAGDKLGVVSFTGVDSIGDPTIYGNITGTIVDPTNASEDGVIKLGVMTGGTFANELELTGTELYPTTNNGLQLGNTTNQFSDLFLAEGGVINWDNGDATLTQVGDVVTLAGADLKVSSPGTASTSVATIDGTQTLTNKRVTKRTGTTTSHATPTINTDNVDEYYITAQTEAITSFTTNLSGTPTEGQKLWIAITGTAARAITWGASFEASTVALPTTTVSTNRLDVGFVWNTVTSKWRCIASA